MAARHKGRHKPRHHNHANKPVHTFKSALPPLPAQGSESAASTPITAAPVGEHAEAQTASPMLVAAE